MASPKAIPMRAYLKSKAQRRNELNSAANLQGDFMAFHTVQAHVPGP